MVSSSGPKDGVSPLDSGVGSSVAFFVGRKNFGNGILGSGTVINGFFVRMINVVLAMYRGRAAKINRPNTCPANPCRRACIRRCHMCPSNMLKLNKKYKIAHMTMI